MKIIFKKYLTINNMKSSKEKIISLLKNFFNEKDEILAVYVFGSFVDKEKYHDIDIAVLIKNDFNFYDTKKFPFGYESEINAKLIKLTRIKIDFVVLNKLPILFQKNIFKKNIIIIDRDKQGRINYENNIKKLFVDVEYIMKIKNIYLNRKLNNARLNIN